jgi:hypothetical protein
MYPEKPGTTGKIKKYDVLSGKTVWEIPDPYPNWGGTMVTDGGLMFYGSLGGDFRAVDRKSGKILWSRKLGSGIIGNPITYKVGGRQYIGVYSGIGGWIGLPVTAGLDLNDKFGSIGATAMTKAAGLNFIPQGGELNVFEALPTYKEPATPQEGKVEIPAFPWPPPKASASEVVPSDFFIHGGRPSLGQVANQVDDALDETGYLERSFFWVPDGFAMVTRLEQINSDGTVKEGAERWGSETTSLKDFSLTSYLTALFTAQPGYYRIIVFIVSPHPFSQSNINIEEEEAKAWLHKGLNKLPPSLADHQFSADYSCTALIYEFLKTRQQTNLMIPSPQQGRTHLQLAGLWEALKP